MRSPPPLPFIRLLPVGSPVGDRGGASAEANDLPAFKERLELHKLRGCDDLKAWIGAPKTVSQTLSLTFADRERRFGYTQAVPVHVPSFHQGTPVQMWIEAKRGRFYMEFQAKLSTGWQWFYQLASSHPQPHEVMADPCCGGFIVADKGYEKRLAENCLPKRRVRVIAEGLSLGDVKAFYSAAAEHINMRFPRENPITISVRSTRFGGGHSA